MKVTGYQLRELLRRAVTRRDLASQQFRESLWAFAGESMLGKPVDIADDFSYADETVALLEEAQQLYNARVNVSVLGKTFTLAQAVKRVGGAGRLDKMWRIAALDTGRDRYDSQRRTRSKDEIQAERQVSVSEAIQRADKASQFASALRAAIASANNTEVDLDINPELVVI